MFLRRNQLTVRRQISPTYFHLLAMSRCWKATETVCFCGARNITMALIAGSLPDVGQLGHPVIDQTELSGKFDFTIEWTQEPDNPSPSGDNVQPDSQGPTFLEALQEQLGLRGQHG